MAAVAGLLSAIIAIAGPSTASNPSTAPDTDADPVACPRPSDSASSTTAPARTAPPGADERTIGQVYSCLLEEYHARHTVDHRLLLAAGFAAIVAELERGGLDQASATLPPLSDDPDAAWRAFASSYRRILDRLPDKEAARLRPTIAERTIDGMVRSLHDNHVAWSNSRRGIRPHPEQTSGLGMATSASSYRATHAPDRQRPPLHITAVHPGGPAEQHGLRAGDVIESIDGAPAFVDGVPSVAALGLLSAQRPDQTVRLELRRPATGREWEVALSPASYQRPPNVSGELLPGDIALINVRQFSEDAASDVADTVDRLRDRLGERADLRGVLLDLRGNTGGNDAAFDELFDLLANQPSAVLIDGACASACDVFADLHKARDLGPLVGSRSSGMVSGIARPYVLDNGSVLRMPAEPGYGAHGNIIDGIGVPPDHFGTRTAYDLSTGRDPVARRASQLIRN